MTGVVIVAAISVAAPFAAAGIGAWLATRRLP